jgi:hypothetical protein
MGEMMTTNTLALIQEVYFDLCDLLDHNELDDSIDGFFEFDNLRECLQEQRDKIARIEIALDLKKVA